MTEKPDPLQARLDRLQRQDRRAPTTPADAQADCDSAGELPLSGEETEAIVRYMTQPDEMAAAQPPTSRVNQDVTLYQRQLAAARRQNRIWQAVSGALAACLVVLAGLWFAAGRSQRVIYVQRDLPPVHDDSQTAAHRTNESPDDAVRLGARRVRIRSSYLSLQQQVFTRGVDALPATDVYMPPAQPVTMDSLLRGTS